MNVKILLTGLFLLILVGCATQGASIDTYSDASFSKESIRSLAILPIRNARLVPSEATTLNRRLVQGINGKGPNLQLIGPTEANDIINENNLVDLYTQFLQSFATSGIADKSKLKEIGNALGADAIFQAEIMGVEQRDGQFGWSVAKSEITVRATILDTKTGRLLWEASAAGKARSATTLADAPPMVRAITPAIEKILENLPQF